MKEAVYDQRKALCAIIAPKSSSLAQPEERSDTQCRSLMTVDNLVELRVEAAHWMVRCCLWLVNAIS